MSEHLRFDYTPELRDGFLVLSFTGWMDGGDVSTGTVRRLVDLLGARPFAEIDAEPFCLYQVPGPMEVAAMFRPHIEIEDGLIKSIDLPRNRFYCYPEGNLILFEGQEPHLRWPTFGDCIFELARKTGVKQILFIGSFGGAVPHTRQPRLYITCSSEEVLRRMEPFGVKRGSYEGPGSFSSYLVTQAEAEGFEMTSLVTEIPGYLQGTNPMSIEAVTRRLAKILQLPLDLDSLRIASTQWELEVSKAVEQNEELAEKVRELEEIYDNELLEAGEE